MKYTAAALAATVAVAQAAPVDQVCLPYTTVVYGSPIWKPTPNALSTSTTTATWSVWVSSTSKTPVASTTSTSTWGSWDPSTSKTPVASSTSSSTWATWDPSTSKTPVASSTSSSTWSAWSSWSSSTAAPSTTSTSTYTSSSSTSTTTPYTTTTPTYTPTTSSSTSSTTTSTTTSAAPTPTTCGASKSQFEAFPSGSCGCEFETYCNQGAAVDQNTKFWERTSGELINSLAECQAICNDNTDCTAVIWTDSSSAGSQDFKHCWQTSGLAAVSKDSYGQISYKGTCSSTCSATYNA